MGVDELRLEFKFQKSYQTYVIEALKLGICGSFAGMLTDLLFYGLDSYKVVQQAGITPKLSRIFRGALPISAIGSGPSYGIFFMLYSPLTEALSSQLGGNAIGTSVLLSSIACSVPSSVIYVPSDVVKKRLVIGEFSSVREASLEIYRREGFAGLFLGWRANLSRDIFFSVIKMGLYESLASFYLKIFDSKRLNKQMSYGSVSSKLLTKEEAGAVGFTAGATTALLTCPLDCVNTRIKSGEFSHLGVLSTHIAIVRQDGFSALFRGLPSRIVLLGLGSTVFWSSYTSIRELMFATTSEGN